MSIVRELARLHLSRAISNNQRVVVIHMGDHDPSGIDMTRDLNDRLDMFLQGQSWAFELRRVALTMDQIEDQSPPPNPAKITDSRFENYQANYGDESWELDALQPEFLEGLVEEVLDDVRDSDLWEERSQEVEVIRSRLQTNADQFAAEGM